MSVTHCARLLFFAPHFLVQARRDAVVRDLLHGPTQAESAMADNPFDSIESAHEYVRLLRAEVKEVRAGIEEDVREAVRDGASRRVDALHLVDFKLKRLAEHLDGSSRLLNDLRKIGRAHV